MERMKILITSDGYRDEINGVAQIAAICADEMRRRGVDVKVLTLSDQKISYKNGDDYYLRSYRSAFFPEWKKSHVRKHAFIEEIIAWKPDIIHIHTEGPTGIIANMIADASGAPTIMTSHTDYPKYVFGRLHSFFPLTILPIVWGFFAYGHADLVILPSEKALAFYQHKFIKDKAVVLNNGINLQRLQKQFPENERKDLMKEYGIRDNNKILLVVARLGKEKKITDILKWLQILLEKDPDIQLVIVGDGLYRQKLEKLTLKMNLENAVTFVGKVPPDEVYRFYNIGTVFVSASDFEVNSLAYLEAMACGLPIICRKDLCLKGILEHGVNGYSFETGNEFCRYVLQLLDNDDLRLEIGNNAREMSSRFSDRQFVDSMFELYERICTKQEEVFVQ